MPAMPLPPAMQSTCFLTSGWNVACPRGAKRTSRAPSTPSPKSHSLTAPPGFFFTTNDRRSAPRSKLTMEYARPGDARDGDERELARREVERRIDVHVERDDVVRQPPDPPHDTAEGARGGRVRLGRLQRADLQRAVVVSHALAREQVALALEIFPAGGLGPLALRAPARQPRLARPAGARGALVGKLDPASQTGVEDLLPGLALEVACPVLRADDDSHGSPAHILSQR